MKSPAETFEEHRSLLLGLSYRLLGSMWDAEDAEDVVQEAYLRWMGTDQAEISEPRGRSWSRCLPARARPAQVRAGHP